ncbi:hypothetical protein [Hydrogenophaga flava]|uniref:hypothetical protein n=1 Tax=Hydrogenophaga flava TaxID=65657 RepID=UPI000A7F6A43|nr:hypothetical protein [Hydrogenophaga flava]
MSENIEVIGGNRFAVLNNANFNEVMGLVRNEHVYGVMVSRRAGFCDRDLSCLKEIPELKALLVSDEEGAEVHLAGIECLPNLEQLHLYSSRCFDFSVVESLIKLKELRFGVIKGQVFPSKSMPSVVNLYIDGYPFADLNSLSVFSGLTSLELTSPRRLENLESLICFPALRELRLAYCPKLHDLSGLGFVPALRKLEIDSSKNIHKIVIPDVLQCLEKLVITKSARLDRIDWVVSLLGLKYLVLMDVDVCGGDLLPLRRLSSLEYLMVRPSKKHYNLDLAGLMLEVSRRKNS